MHTSESTKTLLQFFNHQSRKIDWQALKSSENPNELRNQTWKEFI